MTKIFFKNKFSALGLACCGVATALTASVALTSCSDFLDKEPDDRVELSTEDQVVMLLTASYPDANYGWFCELSSDNIMDLNAEHYPIDGDAAQNLTHYNLGSSGRQDDEAYRFEPVKSSTSSDTPGGLWSSYYITINSVNEALAAIDQLVAEGSAMTNKLTAAKGEALLIRSYCHFVLVNVFSQAYKTEELSKQDIGIPYITEVINTVDDSYSRSNVTDTYKKIIADLEEGLKCISDINYEKPKYHFNENAAHAYACRVYLFHHQWQDAIEQANMVLGTDKAQLLPKLFDYAPLDDCSYLDDFANVWQNPNEWSNLMLIDTYSTIFRKSRYRYEQGGMRARAIYFHNAPMWRRWVGNPAAFVSGLFGSRDYGFCPGWIGEQFQYSDKVAGIGYAHTFRREFTATELLLERAEAKINTGDLAGASEDLCTYHESTMNFSEKSKETYAAQNGMLPLTDDMIKDWFAKETKDNYNCFDDWDFLKNMDPNWVISADAVPYMNCVNYWRRYETNFTGKRFFDLKRWGMEYYHVYGTNTSTGVQNDTIRMTWNDPRRALEIPQDAIAAGMEPSQPASLTTDTTSHVKPASMTIDELIMK
ncbi:MAG: RagB/SusD family nutrient uptake outer membrane protein [Prevotella sp.]|nr:RagB/SusD family nutrient uptake outer membrane protein [Prevotella sp.]